MPFPFFIMNFQAATESVLGQILSTFGESILVLYSPGTLTSLEVGDAVDLPLVGIGTPYSIRAVFDENYEAVDPNSKTVISSTHPALLVRLSDLQATPAKGDKVTIRGSRVFTVTRMEPDGRGGAVLILHKV